MKTKDVHTVDNAVVKGRKMAKSGKAEHIIHYQDANPNGIVTADPFPPRG